MFYDPEQIDDYLYEEAIAEYWNCPEDFYDDEK